MSFPKSKILSPTAATSVSHNVKQETNVNINLTERAISSAINPVANPAPETVDTPKTVEKVETPTAPNPYAEQITQLQSCVNFLKQVVHLIQSNPLIVSAVVIATQQDLINLIPLLIDNCTNVDIKIDEDASNILFGDINADGVINAQDALAAVDFWLRKGVAPTDDQILAVNINSDSRINTFDALGIVEHFVNNSEYGVITKAATLNSDNQ
jgi:hypothetical protein